MTQDYVKKIYIICGKTDMRKGIDGLATLIQDSFELDPYSDSSFPPNFYTYCQNPYSKKLIIP
ncbi:IS66 family insertion sequence element accessory protein TnpB [Bacillus sp. FJAT-49711]|nr:IS66 family insertion sequence element accessory protein TnpB [Bacillus sp. FJAT-49711]